MTAVLNVPLAPFSNKISSHRGAQGVIYADMIRQTGVDLEINWSGKIQDHNRYDALYAYHGNDWFGSLNLFGGVQGCSYAYNIRNVSKFKGKVYSLGIPFPDYHIQIKKRLDRAKEKGTPIQQEWLDTDLDNLERMYHCAELIKYPNTTDKLVVGDSHAICMYRPGWTINSTPFKTLNGALKDLPSFITDVAPMNTFNEVEFYFGNIDVRHHLCRIGGDHIENARELARRYVSAVEALPIKNVSIYELLPIEDESRKLPKTGYYKGQPFWGTWEQRNQCRIAFLDEVEKNVTRAKVIHWTKYLLNQKGQLDFEHMEKPKSVHLSRGSYPWWTGEDKGISLEDFFV